MEAGTCLAVAEGGREGEREGGMSDWLGNGECAAWGKDTTVRRDGREQRKKEMYGKEDEEENVAENYNIEKWGNR